MPVYVVTILRFKSVSHQKFGTNMSVRASVLIILVILVSRPTNMTAGKSKHRRLLDQGSLYINEKVTILYAYDQNGLIGCGTNTT